MLASVSRWGVGERRKRKKRKRKMMRKEGARGSGTVIQLIVFRVVQPLPAPISASNSIRIPGVSKPCLFHGDNNGQ